MAFSDNEISTELGDPVALYEFRYGNTYWRYCTSDEDVIGIGAPPVNWTAKAITDEGVTQGGSDQNDLQIIMPAALPVPQLFREGQPSGKLWLTVRRYHLGDGAAETPIQWMGTVVNSKLEDAATSRLYCRNLGGTFDRAGLRLSWMRNCPHPLYGVGCFVDKALHAYAREVATLTGNSFTCTAHAEPVEGSFSGGFVEWDRGDGSMERRAIERQIGNDFRILGRTNGMEVGMDITVYPGCPHDTNGCKRFNNLPNYGGIPHLPGKSPFDGTPVF
jgi:hypothetical protein